MRTPLHPVAILVLALGCEGAPAAPPAPDAAQDTAMEPEPSPDGAADTMADDRDPSPDLVPADTIPAADTAGTDAAPMDDPAADHAALTDGVRTINLGSALASALVVHGERAFPVVYDGNHVTFIAAARAGSGRLLEWGHEALLENPRNTTDDRGRLCLNAVRWALRGREGAVVGVDGGRAELREFLTANGFTVRLAAVAELPSVQVWITGAGAARTPADAARIREWVRAGGGLLVGGHAWYWGYSNRDPAVNFPGNVVLNDLGLTVTTDPEPQSGTPVTVRAPTDLHHATRALERVRDHTTGTRPLVLAEQVLASATVRRAVRFEPLARPYMDRVRALRAMLPDVIPTAARPVRPASQPIEALTVTIDTRLARDLPSAELRAHPAALDFPGSVPAGAVAGSVTRALSLSNAGRTDRIGGNSDRPVWRSTGLYAAPGARVTVTVPAAVVGSGVDVLLGSFTDDNFSTDAWTRMPVVTRSFAVTAPDTEVACAFGGLVYLRVPPGASLGTQTVTFRGALEAPRYVHGVTSLDAWRSRERGLPGVYAELESAKLVLTVPSSLVRALEDPSALMTFWDRVLDVDAELAALDPSRPRAERIVFDRQIVAGYMHAGYPIMAHTPQAAEALDLSTLRTSGNWGFFHELGHNHQFGDWSWSGTGECTVNLWSVYAMQHASGRAALTGHGAISPAERASRLRAYVTGGRNFSRDWSVWTCLETFLQLQEGFGWGLFQRLDREYLGLSTTDRPRTEAERIQQWVLRSSRAANRNLAPFYSAWGFPLTEATRSAVGALPVWAEDPMR